MTQKKITSVQIDTIQASQVTGIIPITSGGTGLDSFSANAALYTNSAGVITSGVLPTQLGGTGLSSFTVKGAVYASSANALTTGTLPIDSGGTGATTVSGIISNILPSQAGNNNKVLGTDGSGTLSWVSPGGVGTVTSVAFSGGTTGLTVSGGPITSSGTFTLAGTLGLANGGTGLNAVPGSSGQLLMNSSGVYSGTGSRLTYNGSTILSVGASDSGFAIIANPATSNGAYGSNLTLQSGPSGANVAGVGGGSGVLTLAGGDGNASSGSGGDVVIRGGVGPAFAGNIYFRTGNSQTERLRFTATGAWGLSGANYGTSGQVLTSNGSGSSPTWTTLGSPSSAVILSALGYTPVNKAGDTMTGALTLSENPTANLHAATKQYVDTAVGGAGGSFNGGTVANATTFSSAVTLSSSLAFGTSYSESTVNINAASTTNIDCALSNNFIVTMSSNITSLTFSNLPTSGRLFYIALIIKQDATGGRTLAWPASFKWPSGTGPAITSTANKFDIITIMTFDGGTSWFGFVAGQNY